jgi:S1-C subfamily serine protease
MISDPAPVLAPDSYAPACPSGSSALQAADSRSTTFSGETNGEWFGLSGNTSEKGFKVSSVRVGSPAAELGLQAGDVLVRVNCRPVHNLQDLESAFASSTGTVWISYLIQSSWLIDRRVFR